MSSITNLIKQAIHAGVNSLCYARQPEAGRWPEIACSLAAFLAVAVYLTAFSPNMVVISAHQLETELVAMGFNGYIDGNAACHKRNSMKRSRDHGRP